MRSKSAENVFSIEKGTATIAPSSPDIGLLANKCARTHNPKLTMDCRSLSSLRYQTPNLWVLTSKSIICQLNTS
jgi:hypothetical protein